MFVKPVPGRIVRDPVKGTFLPESGEQVPDNIFWGRRLKDGDVQKFDPSALAKPVAGKKSQESDQ
ncbi:MULTISPECIES: DUF2635 domain-containing protein [Serratia]|uniref:DUF2635 domain-containing protein n=1 Tax=Serratia TaxID=613 RepID=UPI000745297F|nr:DUF2635 domain-containing protein [Serratia marcescens]MDU1286222.1 DUF2635 domain-containing protein [Serratia marcescens]MDU1396178.1 DUF2635 domain-containing protein [Serratia marcescens]CUY55935.1 Protein of uncharacterised function (DUF2635) [Serratia marcescens]CVD10369.1 Protein of uncharacterised function (DUF2635) [Serratia marcescens]CVF62982.1 Protein of uncharacterised function (DUF2635) [Serratia marcescens]